MQLHVLEAVARDRRDRSQGEADRYRLAHGPELTIRPVHIGDVDRLERMFGRLSRESIRFRFFSPLTHVPRSALLRLALVDHESNDALVALDGDEVVGIAGYNGSLIAEHAEKREAEIAVAVEDAWQHRGLARKLVRRLSVLARERGYETFVVRILPENRATLGLLRRLAPDARVQFAGGEYSARLDLVREPVRAFVRSDADRPPT